MCNVSKNVVVTLDISIPFTPAPLNTVVEIKTGDCQKIRFLIIV